MNLDRLAFLANALILLNVFYALATLVQWAVARRLGIVIKTVQIFMGKSSACLRCCGTPVEFGWIPTGSTLTYDVEQFFTRPRFHRLIMVAGGPGALLLLAMLLLGWGPAMHHFLAGVAQYLVGGVPFKVGLLTRCHELWQQSVGATVSLLAAKAAAFAMVNTFAQLFAHVLGSPESRFWAAVLTIHTLLLYAVLGYWLVAIWHFLARAG